MHRQALWTRSALPAAVAGTVNKTKATPYDKKTRVGKNTAGTVWVETPVGKTPAGIVWVKTHGWQRQRAYSAQSRGAAQGPWPRASSADQIGDRQGKGGSAWRASGNAATAVSTGMSPTEAVGGGMNLHELMGTPPAFFGLPAQEFWGTAPALPSSAQVRTLR